MDNKPPFEIDKKGIPSFLKRKAKAQCHVKQIVELKRAYTPQSYSRKLLQNDSETLFQNEVKNLIDDLQGIDFDSVSDGYDRQEVDSFIKLTVSSKLSHYEINNSLIAMIEEHEFTIKKSGYDPRQVDEYLDSVCESIEDLMRIRDYNVVKFQETDKKRKFGDYGEYNYKKSRDLSDDK